MNKQILNMGKAFTLAAGFVGGMTLPTLAECWRTEASWYGPGFHGKTAASGETFNENAMTAAHRTLPFGTEVEVTNLNNGEAVVVTINDRGPFHGKRDIDVSKEAATRLGFKNAGTAPAEYCVL